MLFSGGRANSLPSSSEVSVSVLKDIDEDEIIDDPEQRFKAVFPGLDSQEELGRWDCLVGTIQIPTHSPWVWVCECWDESCHKDRLGYKS